LLMVYESIVLKASTALCDLVELGPQRLANCEAVRYELLISFVLISIAI
jgi:hypothetical protein